MSTIKNYEIIATLGPASHTETLWQVMLAAGVTTFRLNTSHLSLQQLEGWLEKINAFRSSTAIKFPLVLDLQGSKWRLGEFPSFDLVEGERVTLIPSASTPNPYVLPVPHADFFKAAPFCDGDIVLNDAKSRLKIETAGPTSIQARVVLGGKITPHKGITFTTSDFRVESLSEKDQAILDRTITSGFIHYAISYVRDAEEMQRYRVLFGKPAYLIAKVERAPAVEQAQAIANLSNEVWLCRGDLGAEVGLRNMAKAVHDFREKTAGVPVPLIMAGQVLEHMTDHPTPTRSEICYLYDTLLKDYQGFVLSDETAVGRYPLEACQAAAIFKTNERGL